MPLKSYFLSLILIIFCSIVVAEDSKKKKPMLGVSLADGTTIIRTVLPNEKNIGAVIINKIVPGSAADKSDLLEKDLLIQVGEEKVSQTNSVSSFISLIKKYKVGDTVTFTLYRLKRKLTINGKELKSNKETIQRLQKNPYQSITIQQHTKATMFTYKIRLGDWLEVDQLKSVPTEFPKSWKNNDMLIDLAKIAGDEIIQKIKKSTFSIFMMGDAKSNIPGVTSVQFYLQSHPLQVPGWVNGLKKLMKNDEIDFKENLNSYLGRPLLPNKIREIPFPSNEREVVSQLKNLMNDIVRQNARLNLIYLNNKKGYDFFIQEYMSEEESLSEPAVVQKEKYLAIIEKNYQLYENKNRLLLKRLKKYFSDKRMAIIRHIFRNLKSKKIITSAGVKIIIGGTGDDVYFEGADLIIDVGGDDQYLVAAKENTKTVLVDLEGNDIYSSQVDNQFGAGFFKISFLLDAKGDDVYSSKNFSFGACIFGAGLLNDQKGNDIYYSQRFSMGVGLLGDGVLQDDEGDDLYQAGIFSIGVGLYQGLGCVIDKKGNDRFVSTASVKSSYGEKNIYDGLSMGVGYGLRNFCRGGIGLLLDYEGDDVYHAGNFSIGQGYYFGLGGVIDLKGNDRYASMRYGIGSGAHSAIGFFVDSEGNDQYSSSVHAIAGAAWDLSIAYFLDELGDDQYFSNTPFSFGAADHSSLAFHFDLAGDDNYQKAFYTNQTNTYHNGESFGVFVNQKGVDVYPKGFGNNSEKIENQFYFKDIK